MPVWINVTSLSCSFPVSLSVSDSLLFLPLNRQPPCSPGKVSFTPQRKSPSSMIARAYHKTLDKCQRGLRGGDLEDIWRRDRPDVTVAHTHTHAKALSRIHKKHQVWNKKAWRSHTELKNLQYITHRHLIHAVHLTPYIQYLFITFSSLKMSVSSLDGLIHRKRNIFTFFKASAVGNGRFFCF